MADQPAVGEQSFERLVRHRPHPARREALEHLLESRPFGIDDAVLEPGAKDPQRHLREIAIVAERLDLGRAARLRQARDQRRGAVAGLRRFEDRGKAGALMAISRSRLARAGRTREPPGMRSTIRLTRPQPRPTLIRPTMPREQSAMKLMWFHLMPYTELPDDFRDKHPSVWVDIHSSLFDPRRAHHMYNDFMDELEFAAECGFDAICVNEHHSNGYGLMPSPNLIASALARRTTDTALCVMGNSLALYNPPTRVAEEFAMIDVISGGRLIAGFPVGTPMDTCFAYGQNPSSLRERYLEGHDLVLRAWTEPDTFAFNGRFNQQRYVNIWPRPVQKPHPPIWIPGGGSVETWQWCAQMDYVYAYLSYFGFKDGRATIQGFWDEMARLGKDRNPYRAGFLQFVGVAENRAEAMRLYKEPAEYFYGRCLRVDPRWAMPPGYITEATQRAGVVGQIGGPRASTPGKRRARRPTSPTSSTAAMSSSARPTRSSSN